MKKAAIYARVSTEGQTDNYSIPTQLEGCRDYAKKHDFKIADEYVDGGHTGTSLDRPELNRLKQLAGKVDAIIVFTQDRLGRAEALDTWNLVAEFDSNGTEIHCTDTGLIRINNFLGQLEMLFRAKAAKEESEKIGERSQRGKKARARAGKVVINTVASYGYDYDKEAGMLVIVEEQAEIVRQIYHWYVYGDENGKRLGGQKIANKLTEMRVPTKHDIDGYRKDKKGYGFWGRSSVMKILRQETYCGVWYYNRRQAGDTPTRRRWKDKKDWIAVDVPAIVSRELWEAAQNQGKKNTTKSSRNTKRQYLMQGIMFCATCGYQFMCRADYRKHDEGLGYYPCHGQEKIYAPDGEKATCSGSLKQKIVDTVVWDTLSMLLKHPEVILQGLEHKRKNIEEQLQPDRKFLARCKNLLEKSASRRNRLLKLYLDGNYEKDWLDAEMSKIEKECDELQDKINDLETRIAEFDTSQDQEEQVRAFCHAVTEGIDNFTFEDKRMVLDVLNIKAVVQRNDKPEEHTIFLSGYIPTVSIDVSFSATPN